MRVFRLGWLVFTWLVLIAFALAQQKPKETPIRLIIVFSIDQCRADYLTRFTEHYLPPQQGKRVGGFQFLAATGAHYRDAHFAHVPTHTGPGHATLLTGSAPCLHGILANGWFDRETGKEFYCVEDDSVQTLGGPSSPMSARALLTTTVGDELKMATNGQAKVVAIAYKDRAAILMAGHAADTVIWFDDNTGNWVTSTFYAANNRLPEWVSKLNAERWIDRYFGKAWEPLLPDEKYLLTRSAPGSKPGLGGRIFSYKVEGDGKIGRAFYKALASSGFGNDYVFETAKRAVLAEGLGQDGVPDLLVINLSTNDYIGHTFGPNSPEVMDISVRTDRLLSDFLNFLQERVQGGLDRVVIAVSADHGVVPYPEEVQGYRGYAGRVNPRTTQEAVEKALDEAFGEANWVLAFTEPHLYLNREAIKTKGLKAEEVERTAAQAASQVQGVYYAFTRTQILNGQLPAWEWTQLVVNGFHPRLGGDVVVIDQPNWYAGGGGTGHYSPWVYDTHVPLLLRGPGIKHGRFMRRVTTMDLAPTLSQLLNIEYPSGCLGKPLVEALGEPSKGGRRKEEG